MCKSCFDFCMCIHDFCYTFHHEHSCFIMMGALLVLAIIVIIALLKKRKWSHTWTSGKWYVLQIIGAILKSYWSIIFTTALLLIIIFLSPKVASRICDVNYSPPSSIYSKIAIIAVCCIFFGVTAYVMTNLNKLYSLRKQETRITISQIILLATFGICLTIIVYCLGIKQNDNGFIIITTFGAVLSWIFQDTIKSVVAFFYLRANGLLNIGDWIEVANHGINGIVRSITLTTVQIENWDTTTSSFPVYILHAQHFKNNQRMLEGRTHGRLMSKSFIIDTGWIHNVSEDEAKYIKKNIDTHDFFIQPGELNIHLFRRYIYHWLMQNSHICQQPRLFVAWKEQTKEGLPLHIYAFINDTKWEAYEWQQSAIIEHVIQALSLFNLQLYQSPSGYDASNSNIHLTDTEANYRKY